MSFYISKRRFCLALAIAGAICLAVRAEPMGRELTFTADGTFKIVQFTDIHWKHRSQNCQKVLHVMTSVLDVEQPDLVILTGDIVTSRPARKGWEAVIRPIVKRKIYWAATLGNHDDEQDLTGKEIIALLEKQPYSLVRSGPANIAGEGNYILKVKDARNRNRDVAAIYCLDSLAYAPKPRDRNGKYAWIEPCQIKWYRRSSRKITKSNRGTPLPSLAFFHIPFPEFNTVWDSKSPAPIGRKGETVCCPKKNTHMFTAMTECKDIMGVFVGHDHKNDYAGSLQGICLAYGRVTGFDTYGDLPQGARVIELTQGKREFDTWIRTGDGKRLYNIHYPTSFSKTSGQTNSSERK